MLVSHLLRELESSVRDVLVPHRTDTVYDAPQRPQWYTRGGCAAPAGQRGTARREHDAGCPGATQCGWRPSAAYGSRPLRRRRHGAGRSSRPLTCPKSLARTTKSHAGKPPHADSTARRLTSEQPNSTPLRDCSRRTCLAARALIRTVSNCRCARRALGRSWRPSICVCLLPVGYFFRGRMWLDGKGYGPSSACPVACLPGGAVYSSWASLTSR